MKPIFSNDEFTFCNKWFGGPGIGTMFGGSSLSGDQWYTASHVHHGLERSVPRRERLSALNWSSVLSLFEANFERLYYTSHGDVPDGYEAEYGGTSIDDFDFSKNATYDLKSDSNPNRTIITRRTSFVFRELLKLAAGGAAPYSQGAGSFCYRPSYGSNEVNWASFFNVTDADKLDVDWTPSSALDSHNMSSWIDRFAPFDVLDESDPELKMAYIKKLYSPISWEDQQGYRPFADPTSMSYSQSVKPFHELVSDVCDSLVGEQPIPSGRMVSDLCDELSARMAVMNRVLFRPWVRSVITGNTRRSQTATVVRSGTVSVHGVKRLAVDQPCVFKASDVTYSDKETDVSLGPISIHPTEDINITFPGAAAGGVEFSMFGMGVRFLYSPQHDVFPETAGIPLTWDFSPSLRPMLLDYSSLHQASEYMLEILPEFAETETVSWFEVRIRSRLPDGSWDDEGVGHYRLSVADDGDVSLEVALPMTSWVSLYRYNLGELSRDFSGHDVVSQSRLSRPCAEAWEAGVVHDANYMIAKGLRVVTTGSPRVSIGFPTSTFSNVMPPDGPIPGAIGNDWYALSGYPPRLISLVNAFDDAKQKMIEEINGICSFDVDDDYQAESYLTGIAEEFGIKLGGHDEHAEYETRVTHHVRSFFHGLEFYFERKGASDGESDNGKTASVDTFEYVIGYLLGESGAVEQTFESEPQVLTLGEIKYSLDSISRTSNELEEEELDFYTDHPFVTTGMKMTSIMTIDYQWNHCFSPLTD